MNNLLPIRHSIQIARNPNFNLDMLVLSHSTRSAFRSCARKLEFRQFYGESPYMKEDNYAGSVGTALHRGLAAWLETGDETKAITAFLLAFPYHLEYIGYNSQRSLEACYNTLMALMESNQLRPYDIAKIRLKTGEEKFCIEVPFALEITGTPLPFPVWFVGFLDEILYNEIEDRYVVVDLKTTRQKFDDLGSKYTFDEQCIPYAIVLEHALGRQIDELEVSYLSAYIDLMKPNVEMFPFKKTKDDVHDWHRGLCDDIARIAKYYRDGWFPRATNGDTCISWNRKCQFMDECSYRNADTLKKIIQGTIRTNLFSTGEIPWITASLAYVGE